MAFDLHSTAAHRQGCWNPETAGAICRVLQSQTPQSNQHGPGSSILVIARNNKFCCT
jgi:hypothetical protein